MQIRWLLLTIVVLLFVDSYPEVNRVNKAIEELTWKESGKFLKQRGDRIEIQINHLITKQENEVNALDKKLNTGWAEHDKVRKRE